MAKRKSLQSKPKNQFSALFVVGVFLIFGFMVWNATHYEEPTPVLSPQETFIQDMKVDVIEASRITHVRPSIVMAQAILESNWGASLLSVEANNYFGIKGSYHGESFDVLTHEYYDGENPVNVVDTFRKYPDRMTSILDHGDMLRTQGYQSVIDASTYQEAAQQLQNLGYATDPTYAQKLIDIIETYQLDKLDS